MSRAKNGTRSKRVDQALREASWHISHAMELAMCAPKDKVESQWFLAASKEELAAFDLETEGLELEAAVHRISAASCYEMVKEYQRALTLLHAALSVPMRPAYRTKIEKQLKGCLVEARKHLSRKPRKKPAATRCLSLISPPAIL